MLKFYNSIIGVTTVYYLENKSKKLIKVTNY